MTRPALSLSESECMYGEVTQNSANKTKHATFLDKHKAIKHGYKKPCSDKYPELLAKYSVAFSVLVRAALGERAAEERLVINKENKICGTFSLEVPNFIPLSTSREAKHTDPHKEALANPDINMLIKKDVAALLISAYKHKNNDLHPGNISVNGLIDWDELYYELTSIIKGARWFSGSLLPAPSELIHYKVEDLRNFPKIPSHIHWPANESPKNFHPYKRFKTTAFQKINKSDQRKKFHEQKNAAILKELLCFEPKMLRERLTSYLGDAKLNLKDLPDKEQALLAFGKDRKLFYDEKGKERTFVDHCMTFFIQENNKFKDTALEMKEFKDFLIEENNNPTNYRKIWSWLTKQNEKNKTIAPYNIDAIGKELHEIWRQAFKPDLEKIMMQFKTSILANQKFHKNLISDPKKEMTHEELHNYVSKLIQSPKLSKDKTFMIAQEIKTDVTDKLNNHLNQQILDCETSLYNKINQLKNEYYANRDANIHENHEFIQNIKNVINQNKQQRNELTQLLEKAKNQSKEYKGIEVVLNKMLFTMESIDKDIEKFTKECEKFLKNIQMNYAITASGKMLTQLPLEHHKLEEKSEDLEEEFDDKHHDQHAIRQVSEYLSQWAANAKNKHTIDKIIMNVQAQYSSGGIFYAYWRRRNVIGKPLKEIFDTGGWSTTSLNTLLIKELCLTMLKTNINQSFFQHYYTSFEQNNMQWWQENAMTIAIQAGLKPLTQTAEPKSVATSPAMSS